MKLSELTKFDLFNNNKSLFINAYSTDINKPNESFTLYLQFKYEINDEYIMFDKNIRNLPNYLSNKMYIIKGERFIVYRLKLEDSLISKYEAILNGRTKYLSFKSKNYISSFWGYRDCVIDLLSEGVDPFEDILPENEDIPSEFLSEEMIFQIEEDLRQIEKGS